MYIINNTMTDFFLFKILLILEIGAELGLAPFSFVQKGGRGERLFLIIYDNAVKYKRVALSKRRKEIL